MTGGLLGAGVRGCGEIGSGGHSQWNSIRWDLALCSIDIRQHIVITLWQHWIHSITLSACCTHRNLGKARRHRSYRSQGNHSIKAVWSMFPLIINRPLATFIIFFTKLISYIIKWMWLKIRVVLMNDASSAPPLCCHSRLMGCQGRGRGRHRGGWVKLKPAQFDTKYQAALWHKAQWRQTHCDCGRIKSAKSHTQKWNLITKG